MCTDRLTLMAATPRSRWVCLVPFLALSLIVALSLAGYALSGISVPQGLTLPPCIPLTPYSLAGQFAPRAMWALSFIAFAAGCVGTVACVVLMARRAYVALEGDAS